MRCDEILGICVIINGIKHIPYPRECPQASGIRRCDYRALTAILHPARENHASTLINPRCARFLQSHAWTARI
ncbi:MAG: hypothetical protein OIN66_15500 [Candidatus Methanoperedens sp.]|nr:hypothetical protein [Candidatus Methanoperedens sp.]